MSDDKNIKKIQSDIRAIKCQLEALACESRIRRLDALSFLLDLACKEINGSPDLPEEVANVSEAPLTLQ